MSEFTKDNNGNEDKPSRFEDYDDDENESGINNADTEGILTQSAIDQNKLEYYQNMASLGPDSDDEGFPVTNNATDVETNSEDEEADNSYAPLAEEFGEFVSSDATSSAAPTEAVDGNFADFINPTGIFRKNGMNGPEVKDDDNIEESALSNDTSITPNVSIPPLTQGIGCDCSLPNMY